MSTVVLKSLWLTLVLAACYDNFLVAADWIDQDTPEDARMTSSLTVTPGKVPHETSSTKKHKHTKHPATTAPTESPTQKPTPYPTYASHTYELVFSEEFNVPGRTFEDGKDPRWTALEKNDYTNDALHYYTVENAVTDDEGNLVIKTEAADTDVVGFDDIQGKKTKVTKHFRSAMLQTWNKFCFTGGIIEAAVELPGEHNVGGLWPAFWLLGNLARHTYVGSSEHIWPWSSGECNPLSFSAQHFSACHTVAHYGMEPGVGRGSPEIDIFEVQPGNIKANNGPFIQSPVGQPFMSSSFQVAPGIPNRVGNGWWPGPGQWYEGLVGGQNTSLNIGFYGNYNHFRGDPHPEKSDYWSDAVSYNRQLEEKHFNGTHTYRLEWDVPTDEKDGYLHWFLDGELVLAINGTGIRDAGQGSEISSEPSYILLNTAVSSQWGFPIECPAGCTCKKYDCHSTDYAQQCGFSPGFCKMMLESPPEYKVDWIRVYQNPDFEEQKVGCSTPERPTRRYIEGHEMLYKTEQDVHPLKPIQIGRGTCRLNGEGETRESCGGPKRGTCTNGLVCECNKGWSGPHCLVHDGYDPIAWDDPDKITDLGFIPPKLFPKGLLVGLIMIVVAFLVALQLKARLQGWTPIPDVDPKLGNFS